MLKLKDIINKDSINIERIFYFFEDFYIDAYRNLRGSGKTRVFKYCAVTFKRWYYSSLINETILSPSNIFYTNFLDKDNYSLKAVNVKPILSGYSLKGFDFFVNTYSKDEHPIINDLKIVVESFFETLEITEYDTINPKSSAIILEKLSIFDPLYIDYLTILAFKLKLIRKMPSLYIFKAQISPEYNDFFELDTKKQLEDIINTSIDISTRYLSEILPAGSNIINKSFIISLLKEPLNTEDIFTKIYSSLGFNMQEIWDLFENPPDVFDDELDGALISSTYFLGILLDQWFFTIFGYYLKLIQPLYFFPINFKKELSFTFDDIMGSSEMPHSLFSPCTFYSLTTLGDFFLKDGVSKTDEINLLSNDVSMNNLCEAIIFELVVSDSQSDLFEMDTIKKPDSEVYVMKIKQMFDKRYWKTIEVTANTTLHDFHRTIANCFGYDSECIYSFFLDGAHAFSEYTAPNTKNKRKKADAVYLKELNFAEKQKFMYKAKLNGDFNIEIELLKIKDSIAGVYYPRIVKRSKLMAQEEDNFIF